MMREKNVHTVCEEASCPNIHECWATPVEFTQLKEIALEKGFSHCESGPLESNE